MFDSHSSPDPEFLKNLLQPLLEDFQYWFNRSRNLLESEPIEFLTAEEQADLLARVLEAQQAVATAQTLINLTEGQVGLDTAVLMPWHHLVTECWQVGMRYRTQKADLR